ncbi:MAG: DUF6973 domain-containing protein [Alkaliphilus sp.]
MKTVIKSFDEFFDTANTKNRGITQAHAQESALLRDSRDNDIFPFGTNSYEGKRIIEIANVLREAKRNGASEAELNKIASLFLYQDVKLEEEGIGIKGDFDLQEDFSLNSIIADRLNPMTQALFDKYHAKGLLCLANGVLAMYYADIHYTRESGIRGNGDAFRHVIWNFGMTIDVGDNFARRWSNAHEFGNTNNNDLDMGMDLYNNHQGILLGRKYPHTLIPVTFIIRSMRIIDDGDADRIINNQRVPTNNSDKRPVF